MSTRLFRSLLTVVAALSLWGVTLPSYAVTLTFTNSTAFFASLPGSASTLDFDGLPVGTLLPSGRALNGVSFTYAIIDGLGGQLDMAVVDDFDTTSGIQSLGLNDPGNFNQFLAGDDFDLGFAAPIRALGLFFTTSDSLVAGDLQLITSVGTALNSATAQFLLADGGFAYFLGLTSADVFINAQIRFAPEAVETFLFTVDDITTSAAVVPEPCTIVLLSTGLIVLSCWLRRQRRITET